VDHTTVARQLDALEEDFGAVLFERSPDGFAVTPLGEDVLVAAERMETEVYGLMRRAHGTAGQVTGKVRLTSTPLFAARLFAPQLPAFYAAHPGLKLELLGYSQSLDLYRREADVAVRIGRPNGEGIVARKLARVGFAFYAAAVDPRPFADQQILSYDEESGHDRQRFITTLVPPERVILRSNSTQTLLEATRAGAGCALLPCLVAERVPDLRRLSAETMSPVELWLAYHEDLRHSPRLRAVIAFIEQVIRYQIDALCPPDLFPHRT